MATLIRNLRPPKTVGEYNRQIQSNQTIKTGKEFRRYKRELKRKGKKL